MGDTENEPPTVFTKIDELLSLARKNESDVDTMKTKLDTISERFPFMETDLHRVQNEVSDIKSEIKAMRKTANQNNLMIFNFPDTTKNNNNLRATVTALFKNIDASINTDGIVALARIGKKIGSRPVLIRFINSSTKASIFKFLGNLHDLGFKIADDLTRKQIDARKPFLKHSPALKKTRPLT